MTPPKTDVRPETNNTSVSVPVTFNLVPPDLLPVSVSAPLGVSGQSVQLVSVVTNQGSGSALGSWYDLIYLSTNTVLESNATPIAYLNQNRNVEPGGSYAWTNSASLPQLTGGTYYLFVRVADANYGSQHYETTKTNNTSAAVAIGLLARASGIDTVSASSANQSTSTTASIVTTVISLPTLRVKMAGTNVVLSWSTVGSGFLLQYTTNLSASTLWTSVSNAPILSRAPTGFIV